MCRGYRQCWSLGSLLARRVMCGSTVGYTAAVCACAATGGGTRRVVMYGGRASEKVRKTGLRALRGEWRTAGERGRVAGQSGLCGAPREEKSDPSAVDPRGLPYLAKAGGC